MQLATHETLEPVVAFKTPEQLAGIVAQFAALPERWIDRVRLRNDERWYERLHDGPDYDVWAISWMPGQSTGFHDHGDSAGAFIVTTGALEEHRPGELSIAITPGQSRVFGSRYAHDVRNVSLGPAVSIHAYSPPLSTMNEYLLTDDRLILRKYASERAGKLRQDWDRPQPRPAKQTEPSSINHLLSSARARLNRLFPDEAHAAVLRSGALLVDIRPENQRRLEGGIPDAVAIERNVLEWRLDPASSARLPMAVNHDLEVIVFCSEGYTSSLAATALQDLGLWRATDVVGGFRAWRQAGLPTVA